MEEELRQVINNLTNDKSVVGYVVRPEIYSRLEITKGEPWSPYLPIMGRVAIYWDADQEEDCIQFTDERVLRLYLNRKEDPKAWGEYLAELLNRKPIGER